MGDDSISKGLDDLSDLGAFFLEPKKTLALETTKSYTKSFIAAAKIAPLCITLSATPVISQVPARHPEADQHLPSQSQNSVLVEMPRMTVATTTAASSDFVIRILDK